ncbi:unnamed protein product [Rhizophagus irregularis]|nr:unnamed protein product [Rhizophagus irregularis]
MKRCWDPNADNRPSAFEIEELLYDSYMYDELDYSDISSIEKASNVTQILNLQNLQHPGNLPYTEDLIIYDSIILLILIV